MKIKCNNCGFKFTQDNNQSFYMSPNDRDTLISSYSYDYAKCPHCEGVLSEIKNETE